MLAGSASGWLSNSGYGNDWFDGLTKPFFMPPGWAFGVVWPILYALLGVALAMILAEPPSERRRNALILFFAAACAEFRLVADLLRRAMPSQPALVVIVVMVGLAALAAGQFRRIRPVAGYLMLPYLLVALLRGRAQFGDRRSRIQARRLAARLVAFVEFPVAGRIRGISATAKGWWMMRIPAFCCGCLVACSAEPLSAGG